MKVILFILLPLVLLAQPFLWPYSVEAPTDSSSGVTTEEAIEQAALPWRDLSDLAVRVKGVSPDAVHRDAPVQPPDRQVGDRASFWVADQANDSYYSMDATLKVVTPHAYMYLADGTEVSDATLQQAGRGFEEKVYAADRRYFGSEVAVGLDGDPHVTIVNGVIPGLGGYFTSVDDYPSSVHPYSNERKAIYINVASSSVGSTGYYSVLAHEFEHMIHWNTNPVEQTWVKEGAAEEATEALGFGASGASRIFEANPDTQLNAWADSHGNVVPHYGAAYLFLSYFLEHYGGYEAGADLLTGDTRGPQTFDHYLAAHGYGRSFEDVFDDWVVANYLDEMPVRDQRYRYGRLRIRAPTTERVEESTDWRDRTVHQFGADYIEVHPGGAGATIRFQGDQTNRVLPAQPHSGSFFWWSNRADMVDTRLTRAFDLTGLSDATLKFWTWYDLEDGYDYGYVMASRDGGATWTTLPATDTQTADPNGNNLGNGFTGRSRGAEDGEWVEESVDLSAFAGETVLIRFEQVTDDAYNAPGFAVDDISIAELGYSDDSEGDGGWLPEGFVRTDGGLKQLLSLQLIHFDSDITVEQVPLSETNHAEIALQPGEVDHAVLVVSGLTRYTTEVAHYRYSVELGP